MENNSGVVQEFTSGEIAYEVLFIFLGGCIGDMFIHAMTNVSFPFRKPWFAQGLTKYYSDLTYGIKGKKGIALSAVLGAFWGGIACVMALLIAKLFLYLKETI